MKIRHVVGLDLSLAATGISSISLDTGIVDFGLVKSNQDGDDLEDVVARLRLVLAGIQTHVPRSRSLAVVEAPSRNSKYGKPHERAGLWWQVVTWLLDEGHTVAQPVPRTRAKYVAGHLPVRKPRSGPDKREIVAASRADFPHYPALKNNNVADAFGLARMGARHLGSPIDPSTPQRVQAVAAVRWPETSTEGMN